MKRRVIAAVIALANAGTMTVLAAPKHQPLVVIHDSGKTVSAIPHYQPIEVKIGAMHAAAALARRQLSTLSAPPQPISLAAHFPLRSKKLRAGVAMQRRVAQLPIPIFVIGMDAHSLQWLDQHFLALRALGARGVVVQAESYEHFAQLQRRAADRGVVISVAPGDPLAEAYQFATYPMLLRGQ